MLSRTHAEFVRKLLELEIPEIYDKTIEIFKNCEGTTGYRTRLQSIRSALMSILSALVWGRGNAEQLISQELEEKRLIYSL